MKITGKDGKNYKKSLNTFYKKREALTLYSMLSSESFSHRMYLIKLNWNTYTFTCVNMLVFQWGFFHQFLLYCMKLKHFKPFLSVSILLFQNLS